MTAVDEDQIERPVFFDGQHLVVTGQPECGRTTACATIMREIARVYAPGGAEADDKAPHFSAEKLDEMVAPVALYPDPILSQVMTAATFPDQAKAANKWAQDHKEIHGQELADQMSISEIAAAQKAAREWLTLH